MVLANKVGIYVNDAQRAMHLATFLAEILGGATVIPGSGLWNSPKNGIMIETVYFIYSYAEHIDKEIIEKIAKKISDYMGDQETIAVELNGKMVIAEPSKIAEVLKE